jgi:lipopolysaccharide transport system permease protein
MTPFMDGALIKSPAIGGFIRLVHTVVRFRALVIALVARDLKTRYKGSALGFLWSFLNPLLMLGIYILVFSVYLRIEAKNYPAFLISGLFPWICFSLSVQAGTNSFVEGRGYITQAVFPSETLPVICMISNLVNFVLTLPIITGALLMMGLPLGWPLLALPVLLINQFLLTLGIVLFLATYNVFFRDISYLVMNFINLLFFAMPIIYPPNFVPEKMRMLVDWNIVAGMISAYQDVFYYNRMPSWPKQGVIALVGLLLIVGGNWVFQRNKEHFAEYL